MTLSDKTTVPLWAVIAIIPTFVGAVAWITFIAHQADASADKIRKLEEMQTKRDEIILEIRERVIRIEEQVKRR